MNPGKKVEKDGLSSRWFSNGVKMYERNYKEGRWHGPVTRWWPNGQKMYVRAYTNGSRHGKEATWRSDGTPIKLADEPYLETNDNEKAVSDDEISVEEVVTDPISNEVPNFTEAPSSDDSFPELPLTDENSDSSDFPSFLNLLKRLLMKHQISHQLNQTLFPVEATEGLPPLPRVILPPAIFLLSLKHLLRRNLIYHHFPVPILEIRDYQLCLHPIRVPVIYPPYREPQL